MMINFAFGACRSAANAEAFITVYAGLGKCETGTVRGGFFRENMDKLPPMCYDGSINLNWRGMRR